MPRQNVVYLTGPVIKSGFKQSDSGIMESVCSIGVIRGFRHIGDGRKNAKIDRPLIICRNQDIVKKMVSWNKNDIVTIKGSIATRTVMKSACCPFCKTVNRSEGLAVYIEPIFVDKLFTSEDDSSSLEYLSHIREISNQVYVFGNLTRDPKKISIKNGPVVTQYPIAVKRKYIVREDPPSLEVDFPWVKSYGQNAINDRNYLKKGSNVFIDGIMQTRGINKKTVCEHCGKTFEWKDRTLEIVPYETEYIKDYYTEEEVRKNEEEKRKNLLESRGLGMFDLDSKNNDYDSDEITEDDISAGIDAYSEEEEM